MTKKEKDAINKSYAELIAYDNEQIRIKDICLAYVKSQVLENMYTDIIDYIGSCGYCDNFWITEIKPNDKDRQTEDFDDLTELLVDQYRNGGYSGDDFAGSVNISINEREYLKFHYSM